MRHECTHGKKSGRHRDTGAACALVARNDRPSHEKRSNAESVAASMTANEALIARGRMLHRAGTPLTDLQAIASQHRKD
jgi:hypothetical protein